MKNVKNLHTPSHIKGLIKIQFKTFQKYFNNDIQILLLLTLLYISSKCDRSASECDIYLVAMLSHRSAYQAGQLLRR